MVRIVIGAPVKACTYNKCKKIQSFKNNIRMKMCKGCKLAYYCSRKCHKNDWNSKHRYECSRLSVKI